MKQLTQQLIIAVLFLAGLTIGATNSRAEGSSVVISEIGAYEASNHEWLEIYNRGTEPVDLTGWKFYEDATNHSLKLVQGQSLILAPGEYAIIAQVAENFVADYPAFGGLVIDSAWSSLKESGEEIGLKDSVGAVKELFTYISATAASLQRVDLVLDDYTAGNWQLHTSGNSAGRLNEFPAPVEPVDEPEEPPVDPPPVEEPPVEVPSEPVEPAAPTPSGNLKINELVSDPADESEEFIELYNLADGAVDLAACSLADGSGKITVLSGQIEPKGFFLALKPKGILNNSGDLVSLDCGGQEIDAVGYGNWDDGDLVNNASVASDPNSLARTIDGQDSDADNVDWQVTTTVTPGAANVMVAPLAPVAATRSAVSLPAVDDGESVVTDSLVVKSDYTGKVIINEVLPNPAGSDNEIEFIELKNISAEMIDLVGWQVGDSGRKYKIKAEDFPSVKIEAGGFLVISRKISGVALNNSGSEKVILLSPDGGAVEQIEYSGSVGEDLSYSRTGAEWVWSASATAGAENIILAPNQLPQAAAEITKPRRVETGEPIIFDGSDSADPDGGALSYLWDFGDGQTDSGQTLTHSYATAGRFRAILTVKDERGGVDIVKKWLTIYEPVVEPLENLPEESVTVTSGNKTTTVKKVKKSAVTVKTTLKEVKQLENGQKVLVKGLVAVEPGVLGSQVMYLKGSGIQVYFNQKDWPDLKVGEEIQVAGELAESGGERRIKISAKSDITVVNSTPAEVLPQATEEISEDLEGHLVTVTGQITEKQGSKFWVDDGQTEMLVYIKTTTGIKMPELLVGQQVAVTGIVSQSGEDYRLLPRYQSDIKILAGEPEVLGVAVEKEDRTGWWLAGGAAGVGCILLALVIKAKIVKKTKMTKSR
ncbi:MAG: lamin tail domain-containing protein [Patescibacteria group bacterium]